MIRNSRIKSFLTLDESKLFAFNRNRMRSAIIQSNHNKIFITLSTFLYKIH